MKPEKMHRRQFLKLLGVGGLATLTPVGALNAMRWSPAEMAAFTQNTVDREAQLVAEIRRRLEETFAGHEMALDFSRIDKEGHENFHIQIDAERHLPVASAFKVWLVLYYFLNTPREEWDVSPSSPVYRTAVFSNNTETGRTLYEVGERVQGDGNAIEKFNDFIINELGLTNGLYSWSWPGSMTVGMFDERFFPDESRAITIGTLSEPIGNQTTAAELAHGYRYIVHAEENERWEDETFREAIQISRELLAIAAPGYRSPFEQVLYSGYIGKDGTLPLGDIPLGRVINDAGIINVPEGQYIVAFMSTNENESVTKPALQNIIDYMRLYEQTIHPSGATYLNGRSAPMRETGFNYGFVRQQGIRLYSAPDVESPQVDNPTRRNTVFGLSYLMQGALLRFLKVDDEWGQIVRDDDYDKTFSHDDWTFGFTEANWATNRPEHIFVRLEDLMVVDEENSADLGYVTDAPEGTSKFCILDIPNRELTLFEGIIPVLRTPIVLNMEETPRGHFYIHRVYMARNMPNYPGVPYSNFLHDGGALHEVGYAIHGAPWHLWSQTVTKRETLRRFSHGCINLPNWERPIADLTMPVDEFVFRWMGGTPSVADEIVYLPQENVTRVYAHNNPLADVFNFGPPSSLRAQGYNWNDVLQNFLNKNLDAPDSFFEPTLL